MAHAVPVLDGVPDGVAASLMVQGVIAHLFVVEAAGIQSGQAAVARAVAGGLGQSLTQFVRIRGGTVLGIVSGAQKADTARHAGAGHFVLSTGAAFVVWRFVFGWCWEWWVGVSWLFPDRGLVVEGLGGWRGRRVICGAGLLVWG
ncbi:hypothetical protein D8771_16185 [Streptomyces albus]|uniref:Uncharacterized protein n=1 Tax=Streptomyces albus TaxID=1888 RepID=A0A8H1LBT8_9ACTN|nr:hypothetical protein D8771_16185 [Streptomyces albus]